MAAKQPKPATKNLIEKFYIVVSANQLIKDDEKCNWVHPVLKNNGCLADTKIYCNFSRCRETKLTTGYRVGSNFFLRPLFGYNGEATITINEYNQLVDNCQVVSDKLCPVTLTPEIIQAAKESSKLK
jgi:hypothetical protein